MMTWMRLVFGLAVVSVGVGCGATSHPPIPGGTPSPPPVPVVPEPEPVHPPTPVPLTSPPPISGPTPPYPYATPAPLEVAANEVAGIVLTRGQPANNIPVTVISRRSNRNFWVRTDQNGVYRVKDVPEGEYYVQYYNDSDNNKVGFWRTRVASVTPSHGALFPAWDVYLVGMQNTPRQGQSVSFPFTARFEPYPLAINYRFRIHNAAGPSGQPLYISEPVPARGIRTFTFTGAANQSTQSGQSVSSVGAGRNLWGYQWDAGNAGEGGCLFQDFVSGGGRAAASGPSLDTLDFPGEFPRLR